jgi:type II secretory pathway component PulF
MQQELLGVLAVGTRSGLPLRNSVLAFAADRPSPRLNRVWNHVLLCIVLPGLNMFHHTRHFRRKLLSVAEQLEQGALLQDALRVRRGIASSDTLLAATVGEASGRLGEALALVHDSRSRHSHLWVSFVVTLLYPAVIVFIGNGITQFQLYFIVPKLEGILNDFGVPGTMLNLSVTAGEILNALAALTSVLIALGFALRFNSTLCWYTPGVAGYYRTLVRARVMEMLAILLEVERPLPEAFDILASAPQGHASRSRLAKATRLAGEGETLAACLRGSGLLPRSSAGLLESAQRSGNLPGALRSLGEHLHRRLFRRFNRLVHIVGPLLIVVLGGLFALVCAGTFLSLIGVLNYVGGAEYQSGF